MRLFDAADPYAIDPKEIAENFIEWMWARRFDAKDRSPEGDGIRDDVFQNMVARVHVDGKGTVNYNGNLEVYDDSCTVLPFKFGKIAGNFRLHTPSLRSLDRCPTETNQFGIESTSAVKHNKFLTSMVGCPSKATHMSFELAQPLENLQTSLRQEIESIWIHAPSVNSFAGLNVKVGELTLVLSQQKSITGIHKQLRNIEDLMIVLPPNFEGGLLGIPMIPGIRMFNSGGQSAQSDAAKAIHFMNEAHKQGKNVHEIQEVLIDRGYAKFARL